MTKSNNTILSGMQRHLRHAMIFLFTSALLLMPVLVDAGPKISGSHMQRSFAFVGFSLLILGIKIGWIMMSLLGAVLFPRYIVRGSEVLSRTYIRAFFAGVLMVVIYIFLMALSSELLPKGIRDLVNLLIMITAGFHVFIGFLVTAHYIGEKIQININSRFLGSTFIAVLYGGTVLILIDLLPILGWLIGLGTTVISLGVVLNVLLTRKRPKPVEPPPAEAASA